MSKDSEEWREALGRTGGIGGVLAYSSVAILVALPLLAGGGLASPESTVFGTVLYAVFIFAAVILDGYIAWLFSLVARGKRRVARWVAWVMVVPFPVCLLLLASGNAEIRQASVLGFVPPLLFGLGGACLLLAGPGWAVPRAGDTFPRPAAVPTAHIEADDDFVTLVEDGADSSQPDGRDGAGRP